MNPPLVTAFPREYAYGLLGDSRGRIVLDFGCGSGENSLLLPRRHARVIGVDISEALLQHGTSLAIHRVEDTLRKEILMNKDRLQGQWHRVKGEAKVQWGKLTDDDLEQASGHTEKLVGLLQERYGYARDRAEREVREFEDRQAAAHR